METINNILFSSPFDGDINTMTVSYETAKNQIVEQATWYAYTGAVIMTSDYGREEYLLFEGGVVVSTSIKDVMSVVLGWQGPILEENITSMYDLQLIRGLEDQVISLDEFISEWEKGEYNTPKKIVRKHYEYEIDYVEDGYHDQWEWNAGEPRFRQVLKNVVAI